MNSLTLRHNSVLVMLGLVIFGWGLSFLMEPCHSRVGGNLMEVPAFAGMTGNLLEVPAFAGMTLVRWDDRASLGLCCLAGMKDFGE